MTYGLDNYSRWHAVDEGRAPPLPGYAHALCDWKITVWPFSGHLFATKRPKRLCRKCQEAMTPKPPAGTPVKQGELFNDL